MSRGARHWMWHAPPPSLQVFKLVLNKKVCVTPLNKKVWVQSTVMVAQGLRQG